MLPDVGQEVFNSRVYIIVDSSLLTLLPVSNHRENQGLSLSPSYSNILVNKYYRNLLSISSGQQSMVTGSIPGFMDVVENFGAGELADDNIVRRWTAQGRRIHFYGDDTWIKLFPTQFSRHQGVTSFFVSDYTEVI